MAKSGKKRKRQILVIGSILGAILLFFVAVVGVGLYLVYDLVQPFGEVESYKATLPIGITMEEVREIHGDPSAVIPPYQPLDYNLFGPRSGDPTTVWSYFLHGKVYGLDGAYLYFNDQCELVRVELIYS